jgi:hypothetical protein
LYNSHGRLIQTMQIVAGQLLSADKLSAGIYYIKLDTGKKHYFSTLIKQ